MMQKLSSLFLLTLFFTISLTGCDTTSTSPSATPDETVSEAPSETAPKTFDEQLAAISRANDGFAGVHLSDDGAVVVHTTKPKQKSTLMTSLRAKQAAEGSVLASLQSMMQRKSTTTQAATYTFDTLYGWKTQLTSLLGDTDVVVSLDIDARANHVKVGVTSMGSVDALKQRVETLGIDANAVSFVEDAPAEPLITLRDAQRPVVAGTEISNGSGSCTLGFSVKLYDGNGSYVNPSFITNAHCAPPRGSVNGTTFYQPSGGSYIGYETHDAQTATQLGNGDDCPSGETCYFADAAVVRYSGTSYNPRIAQPERLWDTRYDPTRIDASTPTFDINDLKWYAWDGEVLNKVGRTTGWTDGFVDQTCKDIQTGGVLLLCQNVVRKQAGDPSGERIAYYGDSGSPVFRTYTDSDGDYNPPILSGILWGGDPNTGDTFYFSHMQLVRLFTGFPFMDYKTDRLE